MGGMTEQRCGLCMHWKQEIALDGTRQIYGVCRYPVPFALRQAMVMPYIDKGADCPTFERKESAA